MNARVNVSALYRERKGLYTCIASNAVGDGESNAASLDVKCKY